MRLAAAIAVIAVAFAAALYIHQRRVVVAEVPSGSDNPFAVVAVYGHPTWEDPVAVLIALGGIAIAVGIVRFAKSS